MWRRSKDNQSPEMGQRKGGEVAKRRPNEMLAAKGWFGRREEPAGVDGGRKEQVSRGRQIKLDRLRKTA